MANLVGTLSKVTKHFYQDGQDAVITGGYWNTDPKYPGSEHAGWDYRARTPLGLVAPMDGEVLAISNSKSKEGYGSYVMLYLPELEMTLLLGHMSRVDVKKGQQVKKGNVLGLSGNTGRSTGPHVHGGIQKGKTTQLDKGNFGQYWLNLEEIDFTKKHSRIAQDGYFTVNLKEIKAESLNVRTSPNTTAFKQGKALVNGDKVRYDSYIVMGGYHWVSWIRDEVRVYAAWRVQDGVKYGVCEFANATVKPSVVALKVGDKVKIKQSAITYATGHVISSWAKKQTDVIVKIDDGKVLFDKIKSWVKMNDVEKIN